LATLAELFLLNQPAPGEVVAQAVRPTKLETWAELGLLEVGDEEVRAAVELAPCEGLILAADWAHRSGGDIEPVMGVAASSRTLAAMTIRRRGGRFLDLGTGCGVLALSATRHADQVVGLDLNTRAVALAEFNRQLNGASGARFLAGNLFDPLGEQRFDSIVCNPPFVIGPSHKWLHSHSGRPADELCQQIVQTAPRFLSPDGFCQVLCNWIHPAGQDWRRRLAGWFAASGCDAWMLHSHCEDVADYAFKRIGEAGIPAERADAEFDAWMQYYQQQGIAAIGFGLVTMRRSDRNKTWFRCDPLPAVEGDCGPAIEKGFLARDFLETHRDDRQLLQASLRCPDDVRCESTQRPQAGHWKPADSRLRSTSGLAFTARLDPAIVQFVAQCDGRRRLIDELKKIAESEGRTVEQIAAGVLQVVRRLIELGFLVPGQEA